MTRFSRFFIASILVSCPFAAPADDPPQVQRHELMERVGEAADPVGGMLKGEREFDAAVVMQSFETFREAADTVGRLFPPGSETGYDTEAKSTIWTDREGFDATLAEFADAVDAAIVAAPQDLATLNAAAGPVFKQCKACHEDYRVEDD